MKIQTKQFHQLSLDELYQILKLRVDVFVVEQECAYPELDDQDQDAVHLFISEKDEIISNLRIYFPTESKAAIGRVATSDKNRGRGLSRNMMDEALAYLKKENQIESIYLQAQEYLIAFYGSYGFKQTSESYLEDGIPHVDMEKPNN